MTAVPSNDNGRLSPGAASYATLQPNAYDREGSSRRRSVDVGGLALAMGSVSLGQEGMGKGWGGWQDDNDGEMTEYAELLSDFYTQTQSAINVPVLPMPPEISDETRQRLIRALDDWHFEPLSLPDEEVLACCQILFEALFRVEGMQDAVRVSPDDLKSFLVHLRQCYRSANPYHNFHHALDVFQAIHSYLKEIRMVPPVEILFNGQMWPPDRQGAGPLAGSLTNQDLFALYVAAVGHDVGHPGFNNMFMKNAQAPLSRIYDHKSALERLHCAFLLPIMKRHRLGHILDSGHDGSSFRRFLLETILSTDMGVHAQFMARFAQLTTNPDSFTGPERRLLVCQALIKCADISNPGRPHAVSQHWSSALAAEWAGQARLETSLGYPPSVEPNSSDPIIQAKGQIFFIETFALPLMQVTARLMPDLQMFANECDSNRSIWRARLNELTSIPRSNYPPVPYRPLSPSSQPYDYDTAFPLSLPACYPSPSREADISPDMLEYPPMSDCTSETASTATPSVKSRSPSPLTNGVSTAYQRLTSISPSELPAPLRPEHGLAVSLPAEVDIPASTISSPLSPRSDTFPRVRRDVASPDAADIRAAYKLRVHKSKSFNRASWAPGLSMSVSQGSNPFGPSLISDFSQLTPRSRPSTPSSSLIPSNGGNTIIHPDQAATLLAASGGQTQPASSFPPD